MNEKIDSFGKLVMEKLRDVSIELSEGLCNSRFESPGHKEIQSKLKQFTPEQKELFVECLTYCIDGGVNDFLANLDKEIRSSNEMSLLIKGQNITELTEGLHRELHGTTGWLYRHSKYGK